MAKKMTLKNLNRDARGNIIEMDIFDVETRTTVKMARSQDVHGEEKKVHIKMTDGTKVTGRVNLGKYPRVSDLFAMGKRFQPVFDCIASGVEGKVLFINKDQVVHVEEIV